jgi:hypothetical protein
VVSGCHRLLAPTYKTECREKSTLGPRKRFRSHGFSFNASSLPLNTTYEISVYIEHGSEASMFGLMLHTTYSTVWVLGRGSMIRLTCYLFLPST